MVLEIQTYFQKGRVRMNAKQEMEQLIENKKQLFTEASDQIWDANETRFQTVKSAESLCRVLEKEGFSIEKGISHMESAFIASYGSGKPVIGILAEYDALANLSQVAGLAEKKAWVEGGNGHGCGHNLLGGGALAGAVGIKDYMEAHKIPGTIQLFGCPAEESGYGKSFMARDGVFDHLDAALTWHPMDSSGIWSSSSLAVYQVYYNFRGIAAHAAAAPELGRSALDAAELMNIGVQFLREHIVETARIHYAFIDAGGVSANVVQPSASLYYFIRAKKLEEAKTIFDRVSKIAEGAAMMTETELEIVFDSACANYIPNRALSCAMNENLIAHGSLNLTKEETEYEKAYFNTISEAAKQGLYNRARNLFPDLPEEEIVKLAQSPIFDLPAPLHFSDATSGSTDVGDVSWVVPTAQVFLGCEPQGTAPHSWQWVANGKSSVAHKGLLAAGKVLAATAYDLLTDSELLKKAQEEHKKMLNGKAYKSGIPADVLPR